MCLCLKTKTNLQSTQILPDIDTPENLPTIFSNQQQNDSGFSQKPPSRRPDGPIDVPVFKESNAQKLLPPKADTLPTLVIDMDETLIYSSLDQISAAQKLIKIPITNQTAELQVDFSVDYIAIHLCVRPGLSAFLRRLSNYYEMVCWTASPKDYANPILNYIDPSGYIHHRLFKDSCSLAPRQSSLFKNLARLNRDLKQIIIVDNNPLCFQQQAMNGIHVSDFMGKPDTVLESLGAYLEQLARKGFDMSSDEIIREWS